MTRWLPVLVLALVASAGGPPLAWAVPATEAHETAPPAETDPPTTEAEAESEAAHARPLADVAAAATPVTASATGRNPGAVRVVPPTPPPER